MSTERKQPEWLDKAVFYEIYPQSFRDTNADGIGDFNGIIEKLDYIKELGCTALWLNPCFLSPFGDAGYDVEDYYTVAPRYGTNEDLVHLFEEAHKRQMHVLLDLVPGHTAVTCKWFKESMKDEKNQYTDRYVWTDSAWEKKWQQSMNDEGPLSTREELKNIMRFWLSLGCDGFRVDMAGSLVKNDVDGKGTIALWQDIRKFLDEEFPAAAMVSEWGEPDKSLIGGFHMDFLLHFGPSHYNDLFRCEEPYFSRRGKGSAKEFVAKYCENYAKTNGRGLICIPSGNHDMDRLARTLDPEEMKIAFAFLLSMPGAPFIYYGDEIGMRYVENLTSVEGGYNRTGSRSPMQWNTSANAGFSSAPAEKLYVPVDPDRNRPNAEKEMADDTSLYSEVKRLIALRMAHPALQSMAAIRFLSDGDPLIYERTCDKETILVIIHPADRKVVVPDVKGEILYTVGGNASVTGDNLAVDGGTAVFLAL